MPESVGIPKLGEQESNNLDKKGDVKNIDCSFFVLDPVRRKEIWRFITYMFLHANHMHIANNIIMQLLVGKLFQVKLVANKP